MDALETANPPAIRKRKSPLRRWSVKIIRAAILVYLGLMVFFYAVQAKLVFPGGSTQDQRDAQMIPGRNAELLTLKARDGEKITALFGKALTSAGQPRPDADKCPSIIYFYGNASCMSYASGEFDRFRRLGANVIVPDFEGYGMSGGKPSETGCYAAADAAYDYLLSRGDIDAKKIVAAGWSLGGASAIDLASRKPLAGVMTFSAFTKLSDMSHLLFPWLPTSLILRYHFDNLSKIATITCPILIAHGTADTIIPPAMADRLAAAATAGLVTRIVVQDANHNDIFDTGGENLLASVGKFLDRLR